MVWFFLKFIMLQFSLAFLFFSREKACRNFLKRERKVFRKNLNRTQEFKKQVEEKKKEIELKLLDLERNWEKSFQKVKREALERKKLALEKDQKLTEHIQQEADKTIDLERSGVYFSLQSELFEKASKEAEKKMPEKLSSEKQRQLRMEFLEELKG